MVPTSSLVARDRLFAKLRRRLPEHLQPLRGRGPYDPLEDPRAEAAGEIPEGLVFRSVRPHVVSRFLKRSDRCPPNGCFPRSHNVERHESPVQAANSFFPHDVVDAANAERPHPGVPLDLRLDRVEGHCEARVDRAANGAGNEARKRAVLLRSERSSERAVLLP